ncbi:MerR family transcriptional regulator [Mammaliicoccus fleurettii]|uniref:MerR family transcriptional regulator n=1 Tax=Mammaliicoccus fleurettii TaxID=150056 RepID=A0ABS5MQ90_9STAP|nr:MULTISPECIES: MerR family transcriptional regulator [Mammaliicoccus]MBL0848280.1 MerR family transcriptional regulator [Mammaliicoccus fleurettii]MBS3673002.1 MerR family transcriptional regulator [Mammaliicoccus fleurettii]MBS3698090.1 MerR family transcriptional regulator [Mammaliicoccus fleurettii]MBW0765892.1 MerR family transcriptional regulator [Mammaliicoccus fleurettii]MEB6201994.1 MerR family transcriptional regulator [Mammaliicoccus fleurettii]
MQKINQIPISEFASLTNVSRQTLIYYDKINLFKPDYKNEIGYRYYSIKQIELISVITLLKELGMPLKEIKEYTQNKSPEHFLNLMYQQKKTIQEQKKHLEYNEMIINDKIQLIKEAIQTPFDDITLQEIEETTFYISDNIANASELDFLISINQFIVELKSHGLFSSQPIGIISNMKDILNGEYNNYSYLYVKIPNSKNHYTNTITLKGQYLIGYHLGLDKNIEVTYSKLIQKIEEMDLKIGKYVYEEFVFDSVIKNNENEYITKIMIEVE